MTKKTEEDSALKNDAVKNDPAVTDDSTEAVQEAVTRLTSLDPFEYEVTREREAKQLGVRVSQLDKFIAKHKKKRFKAFINEERDRFPEVLPWPSKVDTAELIQEVRAFIQRFTVLTDYQAYTVTLFVINTWVHDYSSVSPVLNVNSPARGCGKSTLLSCLAELCKKPMISNGTTAAALCRNMDKYRPTVIYDEADMFMKGDKRMLGILNSGYTKKQAWTTMCVGDNNEPTDFYLYAPKVIAGIGSLDDTLMSRCIMIEMKRKLPSEAIESIRHVKEEDYEELAQKLCRWGRDNAEAYCNAEIITVDGLGDRENNNWEPLFTIAQIAGQDWLELTIEAALEMSGIKQDELTPSEQLLRDIVLIFRSKAWVEAEKVKARSQDIVSVLISDNDKPWVTWKQKGLTPYDMSRLLKPFKVKSRNVRFSTGQVTSVFKGYFAEDFEAAAKHYLSESDLVEVIEEAGNE